jgi:hypothetical protein
LLSRVYNPTTESSERRRTLSEAYENSEEAWDWPRLWGHVLSAVSGIVAILALAPILTAIARVIETLYVSAGSWLALGVVGLVVANTLEDWALDLKYPSDRLQYDEDYP